MSTPTLRTAVAGRAEFAPCMAIEHQHDQAGTSSDVLIPGSRPCPCHTIQHMKHSFRDITANR
jgi:hypothetical protein